MSRIKKKNMKSINSAKSQLGVGLVEFMVASTVGLVLLAGAANVMLATYHGKRDQQRLDQMQENFRYGSNVIMRVVRQGESFNSPFASDRLTVSFPGGSDGSHDCLGNLADKPNTFFVDAASGELRCEVDGQNPVALANGFCSLTVEYGVDSSQADGVIDEYRDPDEDMVDAVSAKVTLAVKFDSPKSEPDECRSISFVTTMRQKVINDASSSPTPPGNSTPVPTPDPGGVEGGAAGGPE